jgi:hypothetical protein
MPLWQPLPSTVVQLHHRNEFEDDPILKLPLSQGLEENASCRSRIRHLQELASLDWMDGVMGIMIGWLCTFSRSARLIRQILWGFESILRHSASVTSRLSWLNEICWIASLTLRSCSSRSDWIYEMQRRAVGPNRSNVSLI